MPPTIFIVPGLWEGPGTYAPVRQVLESHGLQTFASRLQSTGTKPPGNPTMRDDIAHIRSDLERVVDEAGPDGVVAVFHSAGGFVGSSALEGLVAPERSAAGKVGGVRKIVFLAAGLAPEGVDTFGGPFIVEQDDGSAVCVDAKDSLFHDLPPAQADEWLSQLQSQPILPKWAVPVPYCGWRHVPSVYILCEQDRLLPVLVQEKMAALVSAKVIRLDAGHMAQLSQPDAVARIIMEEASD